MVFVWLFFFYDFCVVSFLCFFVWLIFDAFCVVVFSFFRFFGACFILADHHFQVFSVISFVLAVLVCVVLCFFCFSISTLSILSAVNFFCILLLDFMCFKPVVELFAVFVNDSYSLPYFLLGAYHILTYCRQISVCFYFWIYYFQVCR